MLVITESMICCSTVTAWVVVVVLVVLAVLCGRGGIYPIGEGCRYWNNTASASLCWFCCRLRDILNLPVRRVSKNELTLKFSTLGD